MIHLAKTTDIRKQIRILREFDANLSCTYEMLGQQKEFKRTPVAMANLLQQYGFIIEFEVVDGMVYVHHEVEDLSDEEIGFDTRIQVAPIEDFVRDMGYLHTCLFIAEHETMRLNRKEIAAAMRTMKEKYQQEVGHELE